MGGWVKWEKDLETDPRFIRLVRQMRNTCNAGVTQERNDSVLAMLPATVLVSLTMGCLMKLWAYADTHIRADDTLDLGFADIDELVGIAGFAASLPEDWLVEMDAGHVELPGYQEHNGTEAKKRALTQKRVSNKRAREQRNKSVTHVTQARNGRVTGALPDQTRPDQTKTETMCKSTPVANGGSEGKASPTQPVDSLEFEQAILATYPKGPNPPNWLMAIRHAHSLVEEGLATWPELQAVTERYAKHYADSGQTTNIAAHNFFDRRKGNYWQQTWESAPASDPPITWRPPPDDEEPTRANG